MTCRILIDTEPQAGSWNMAVDEALLESAAEENQCTVRWYRWQQATVSLGYFQQRREVQAVPELAALPIVRRLSGGGAIVHHYELTYSCTVPATHPLAKSRDVLYEHVHERIRRVLRAEGFEVESRGRTTISREDANDSLLCFDRQDARDLLFLGHKTLGSAQRRRRGAVLQHGSLLLQASPHAPQFPGLLDLADRSGLNPTSGEQAAWGPQIPWMERLADAVGLIFSERLRTASLAPHEVRRAAARQECDHGPRVLRAASSRREPQPGRP